MDLTPITPFLYAGSFIFLFVFLIWPSIRMIGPTEVGLVTKRFGFKKLSKDNVIAFNGEAGYQSELLMPGWRFKFWLVYKVDKYPWIQIPAGEIGVVIAQVGSSLPTGAKSAVDKKVFGNFTDLRVFIENGGQKGVQRRVLSPGQTLPIHPVGFLVITKKNVYGLPVSPELQRASRERGGLSFVNFGLKHEGQLNVTRIAPLFERNAKNGVDRLIDAIGIITALEGDPLPSGDIASRLGGYDDIAKIERAATKANPVRNSELIEVILGNKNNLHNNYQDFQAFLDNGGKIGLQHDPLLYGAYILNPFLVEIEIVPMLVIEQGEVAVVKSYVGLPTEDTSGETFKFGSLVRPGHRGIWEEPLRTGKYPINPHIYNAEIVPTCILTLNWAEATSKAHNLDQELKQIEAKSREGFIFNIDLQVQIHVPDTKAPKVISIVGTMTNLVNEVLQAAVGNHFRDKLQSMPAIRFIETRQGVQEEANEHIRNKLNEYEVETRGVYIQDVILPPQMVTVLTQREIANQEITTFQKQKDAQDQRIAMEQSKGTAEMQAELAKSKVGIEIRKNQADARKVEGQGEASFLTDVGNAKGVEVRAIGMASAEAYERQVQALGPQATAVVNAIKALADNGIKIMPAILVIGGEKGGGTSEGLMAAVLGNITKGIVAVEKKPVAEIERKPGIKPSEPGIPGQKLPKK
ncbi:MAG: SPFH domain-containing protein [Candidatus Aminicenantes bacterium]|nr:SPFH domain-containing protein [Candidatus Aminicenantes bacterium]